MKSPDLHLARLVVLSLCLSTPSLGLGHAPTDRGAALDVKVREAEFIVRGVVSEIRYGFSEQVSDEEPPIPHTFVTYEIREILKGEGEQQRITLRFMGGPDGAGGYLTVQDVPLFEEGDEDILLVKGNGAVLCPLVRCDGGRYRIVDGRVYTNAGIPLAVTDKGELVEVGEGVDIGVREVDLPAIDEELRRGEAELRAQVLAGLPSELRETVRRTWAESAQERRTLRQQTAEGSVDRPERGLVQHAEPLSGEAFTKLIGRILEEQSGRTGRLTSTDPEQRFEVPPPKPARPLEPQPRPEMTDQERLEMRRFEESGGDPVIRR